MTHDHPRWVLLSTSLALAAILVAACASAAPASSPAPSAAPLSPPPWASPVTPSAPPSDPASPTPVPSPTPDRLVARVGIFGFGDETDEGAVLAMYFDRLAEFGVSPASGHCEEGVAGDASWPDYLPDRDEDGVYSPTRAGCFIDENGNANIRVLCYGPSYIGILGRNGDLKALDAWAWQVSEQQRDDRDPPGICGAPD